MALTFRPDLAAFRLGSRRAEPNVKLAEANGSPTSTCFISPATLQNNAPFNTKSSHSWAVGMTVPMPSTTATREISAGQDHGLAGACRTGRPEQRVIAEVRKADREYGLTRVTASRIEHNCSLRTPGAGHHYRQFTLGEVDAIAYLNAQSLQRHRPPVSGHLVRHRRSMLRLNTVVGQRLLP